MNVSDGGKQPFLHDTMMYSKMQGMVTFEGNQKGMKAILQESKINVKGLYKKDMIKILQDMSFPIRDFSSFLLLCKLYCGALTISTIFFQHSVLDNTR